MAATLGRFAWKMRPGSFRVFLYVAEQAEEHFCSTLHASVPVSSFAIYDRKVGIAEAGTESPTWQTQVEPKLYGVRCGFCLDEILD